MEILTLVSAPFFVLWSFVVPVFEAPDEAMHWQYARHLHDEWRLPVFNAHFVEANSPPLFYAAIASVASSTPTPPPLIWSDGHDGLAHPFGVRLHQSAGDDLTRYWPIRIARLISSLMALIGVYLCGLAAREVTGRESTALLGAGFAAFLPQFTFRGMNVSNDVLVATMSAAFLYFCLRLVMRGFTWRIGVLASAALAGAFLSKINAICLAPVLALVIVSEPAPWRQRALRLAALAGVTVLLVLPWTYRNVVLYGDPFAMAAMRQAVASMVVDRSIFDLDLHRTLPRELFKSFVGLFGYGLKLPKWVYAVYLAFMAFATLGLAMGLRRHHIASTAAASDGSVSDDRVSIASYARVLMILAAIIVLNYLVVLRINLQFVQPQGRYMFPALPAIAVAMAVGIEKWAPWRRRPIAASVSTVGAWAAANAIILFIVVVPTYYPPIVDTLSRKVTPVEFGEASNDAVHAVPEAPELTQQVRVPASDARFAIFEIQGHADHPEMTGSVILGLEHERHKGAERRFPFRWLADGKRRTIYVTSLMEREWHGAVVSIRVVPVDDGTKRTGTRVSVSNVKLAGSIPRAPNASAHNRSETGP